MTNADFGKHNKEVVSIRNTEDEIFFNFSYAALKLLGKNLYSNAANAISELVANSIDAHSSDVYVYIDMSDKKHSKIEILDNGDGMDYQDLAEKYVWVGRNKRFDNDVTEKDRPNIMGRKGIGKLAALYLSNKYYILTKQKNSEVSAWKIDLLGYESSDFPKMERVHDQVSLINESIWKGFEHGTAISLTDVDLRRNGEKRIESLQRVFADYYLLDAIKSSIYVAVKTNNLQTVHFQPVEKKIAYKNFYALFDNSGYDIASKMRDSICFTWLSKYENIGNKPRKTVVLTTEDYNTSGRRTFHQEDGTTIEKEYQLSGWIAVHCTIEQKNAVDTSFIRNNIYQPNRLRLYVRNKLAVDDYFSISPSTQAMSNYIEGEISFNILDDDDLPDIATSSRQDFLADERLDLLIEIVDPIVKALFSCRNKVGHEISEENAKYEKFLVDEAERKRAEEEKARERAEAQAQEANEAKAVAEHGRQLAERVARRERKRSQYIFNASNIEDKNLINAMHSIYNMACRIKENVDLLNSASLTVSQAKSKLEKVAISTQRILSMSKMISKASVVVDDNDAAKDIVLASFIEEYSSKVLKLVYEDELNIECSGDLNSSFTIKIKPISFIMILDNLVGNAIKASAKNLKIIIKDSGLSGFYVVFEDDGRGIDPSITDLNRVFDFGETTTNGSGLGLYYAKKYMNEMNGDITITPNKTDGITVKLMWKR